MTKLKLEKMNAHEGVCEKCGSIVKMWRDQKTLQLLPGLCFCISCGQHYYMETDDIKEWELEQWKQKEEKT